MCIRSVGGCQGSNAGNRSDHAMPSCLSIICQNIFVFRVCCIARVFQGWHWRVMFGGVSMPWTVESAFVLVGAAQ